MSVSSSTWTELTAPGIGSYGAQPDHQQQAGNNRQTFFHYTLLPSLGLFPYYHHIDIKVKYFILIDLKNLFVIEKDRIKWL